MTSPIYSDYTLEAFVNGSLPRAEIQAIEDASQTDHTLLERIESLRAQNQAFLERYPAQGAWVEELSEDLKPHRPASHRHPVYDSPSL